MRATTYFGLALGLVFNQIPFVFSQSLAPPPISSDTAGSTTTYIIELASAASNGASSKRSLTPIQDFYDELRRRDISFTSAEEWDVQDLFVGVVLNVTDPAQLQQVAASSQVVAVRPVVYLETPPTDLSHTLSGPNDPSLPPDVQSGHVMTGVDKVHAEGNFGQGVNIGIIDTGVDYLNPSLGGGFGPGFLIKGGYDFVGDAYTGSNTAVPDSDPMDTCNGHGTHVAGIIAAQPGNPYNITGVAYQASLSAYRVFGCTGVAPDPIVISALIRAYQDGNDIITLSLGVSSGWTETTTGVVASRIVANGRIVTASVGNDGATGAWYPSSPATGKGVIAVGSVDASKIPIVNATLSDGHAPVSYFSFRPFPIAAALPVYATSTDITNPADACTALPASTPNLANYIVVIRRGGCTAATKYANAAAKGGRYFFLYNDGEALGYLSSTGYINALIGAEDGAYLVNAFATNSSLLVSFPQTGELDQIAIPNGGLITPMSSIGSTYDLGLKPSVVAPGGNILSTLPRSMGSYGLGSGTSMSCPFVAGAAALILNAKGKDAATFQSVKKLLQTTAGMVPSAQADGSPFTSVAQQGAGLINAYHAIHAQSTISTSEVLLNDTAHLWSYRRIQVSNPSNQSVTYTITHTPALTVSTIDNTTHLPLASPLPTLPQSASVSFTPSTSFTVPAGGVQNISANFQAPSGIDPSTFPIYSGFIGISSSLGETFSVPYVGVAAKMKDMAILDTTAKAFGMNLPNLFNTSGIVQPANTTFTLQGTNYPLILYRRVAGTRAIFFDLVTPDVQLSGSNLISSSAPRKRGLLWDWIAGTSGADQNTGNNTFNQIQTVGPVYTNSYLPRHQMVTSTGQGTGYEYIHVQQYLNTTAISSGHYRVLVRALKITGDPTNESDYETWLSPEFIVSSNSSTTTTTTTTATIAATTTTTSTTTSTTSTTTSTTSTTTSTTSTTTSTPPSTTSTTSTTTSTSATTSPTPSTVASYNGWNSTGCFLDSLSVRTLEHPESVPAANAGGMTVEACLDACHADGYKYAGVEYASECYCGNIRPSQQIGDGNCTMPCRGNQLEYCGGSLALNVYRFNSSAPDSIVVPSYNGWSYSNCYQDSVSSRSLPVTMQVSGPMTVELCLDACHSAGYSVAGVEWSQECYCGQALPSAVASDGRCDMLCAGNSTEICGGSQGLTVYQHPTTPTRRHHRHYHH